MFSSSCYFSVTSYQMCYAICVYCNNENKVNGTIFQCVFEIFLSLFHCIVKTFKIYDMKEKIRFYKLNNHTETLNPIILADYTGGVKKMLTGTVVKGGIIFPIIKTFLLWLMSKEKFCNSKIRSPK